MANMRFLGKPHMEGWADPNPAEGWKPLCLMAYLCVNLPLRLHTDTELAQLLWPDLPLRRGQRRAEEAVRALNRMLENPVIECTRFGEYRVIKAALSVDVWIFRGGVRMRRHEDALSQYRGELLEGLDLPDAPEFMAWLGRQRRKYRRLASVCAWRAHQRSANHGEVHLAAGLAVLAYRNSSDPSRLLPRVMTSLSAAGAHDEAERLLEQAQAPAVQAVRAAEAADVDVHPGRPSRVPRLGVLLLAAALLLAAVVGVPRLAPDFGPAEPPASTPGLVSERASHAPGRADEPQATLQTNSKDGPATAGPPPRPEAIWDLANRQMAKGAFPEAEALFRLLVDDLRFGEAAATRSLMAGSASRTGLGPPPPRSADYGPGRAARVLAGLRQGRIVESWDLLPPIGPDTSGLTWLAWIYVATYSGDQRLVELVEEAPDTVFSPAEGLLSRHQFLGWALEVAGDSVGAAQKYRQAEAEARARLATSPDDPWAQRSLALALIGLSDSAGARASIERAEESNDGSMGPFLRYKLMEARALMTPPESEARRILTDSLLEAAYPWPLDS
ncbi:MAG: hypothetical protein HKO53_00840, partial [Gemmatimonadetes bacterium]|nr:hypothetical protein [Gemmatimonadota bacterium]